MFTTKTAFAAAFLLATTAPMFAGDLYLGASVGQASSSFSRSDFSAGGADSGVTTSYDEEDTAFKIFLGYEINEFLAIEGGYADFGSPSVNYDIYGGQTPYTTKAAVETDAWFIAAKGTYAINEKFEVFGKLGLSNNRFVENYTSSLDIPEAGGPGASSSTKTDVYYGVGVQYNTASPISFVAEYENFGEFGDNSTGRADVDMFSIGVVYNF
ncbi:outer membrane beta-barrel protein [Celeribacter sp. PS-C1]|uniref:outer membrane beta-barrel protein n=1 Tax=Celeribacter sp. PS-C1 TaxID=2820813 RepID=UPI001CA4ACDC|nr:outer membrane beta-barrel protein [Celeribacter sp. PS-C1]MBW6419557.1 outer membrane beta-barrel protein [Celeribacter sp. PS-C1]